MSSPPDAHRSRAPRILLSLAILFGVGAALLVGAEFAFRQRTARSGNARAQIRFYPHARLGRALVRDTTYGELHINSHGFRGPEFQVPKPEGTLRIIIVGASTTFGSCIDNDAETWPARLEYWLTRLAPGQHFEVINGGVPGMSMLDQVIRLHTEMYAFEPDILMVYAGHGIVAAEDAAVDSSNTPAMVRTASPWDAWLRAHSRLYERLNPPGGRRAGIELDEADWRRAIENATARFRRDLMAFTLISRSMDAKVVLGEIVRVTGNRTPAKFSEAERTAWRVFATPTSIVYDGYQRFHDVWQEAADSLGATFIPENIIGMASPQYFCAQDAIHFNAAGADGMGRRVAEQLLARGVVGATASAPMHTN